MSSRTSAVKRSSALRGAALYLALPGLLSACNAATRKCQSLMTTAQGIVNKVDGKDQASVEQSLAAVKQAHDACEKAGRDTERDELVRAENELQAQLDYLKRKASEPPPKKLTPEQIDALVKHGDPSCPRGQAYRPSPKQEIRCTGPQIIDMNWASAQAYYDGRGYKITTTPSPPTLKAEYGAELVVFTFAAPNDDKPAKCLAYYPPIGMSWEEATGRLTGVPLRRLKDAKTVKTAHGERTLRIDQTDKKLIVYIGDC